jgi:hypothetical protein
MTRPRPTLGWIHSHISPEANPTRETQSRLPWAGDIVTACPGDAVTSRPSQPRVGDAVTARPRPTRDTGSQEANLG